MSSDGKYNDEMFRQDLKVFEDVMKQKDFRSGNIVANRIMSNAHLFDEKYCGIVGFFLKQFAADGMTFHNLNDEQSQNVIKDKSLEFVDNVIIPQLSSNQKNLEKIWLSYNNTMMKIYTSYMPSNEREFYKSNPKLTKLAFEKILEILFNNKEQLAYPTNNLLKGILNEMNRMSKTYGMDKADLYLLSLIVMMDRIDEYIGLTATSLEDFDRRMTNEIIPHVNKLSEISKKLEETSVNDFLWELIKLWRLSYIKFLEARRASVPAPTQEEQKLKPPIKSKLVDELAKSLEDEVGGR